MDTLEKLEELLNKLSKNKASLFDDELNDLIEKYIDQNILCPDCMCELKEKTTFEYRGECHGYPAYEPIYERYCPRCKDE